MAKKRIAKPGDRLPVPPQPIGSCPLGSAILLRGEWWLLTFRIGILGHTNATAIPDPDSPDWATLPVIKEHLFGPDTIAEDIRWPVRLYVKSDGVKDPVARQELGDSEDGKD